MKPHSLMSESGLQEAVAEYLVRQYPDVMFHSDFGSGTKLTPAQAKRQKRQNGYRKGWPDLFIAEPKLRYEPQENGALFEADEVVIGDDGTPYAIKNQHGLFLELKKDGTRLLKRNGDYASKHIEEQTKVLEKLRQRGYCAEFAVGFDQAKKIIDEYLGGGQQ